MGLREELKNTVLRHLPEGFLQPLRKRYYARSVPRFSQEDEPEFAVVERLVKPGDRVIDAGASYGFYTYLLARLVGENGRVFAFEPVGVTGEVLAHCLHVWRLENVDLFH
jgi:hypothetical protein